MGRDPDAGGYDATDAVTYVWLGQAMIMTVAVWGGGTTDDLAERIRTGDVAIDLYRPVGCSAGTSPATSAARRTTCSPAGVAPTVVGRAAVRHPLPRRRADLAGVPGLAWSLAVVVSFGIRFLVASLGVLAARPDRGLLTLASVARGVLQRAGGAAGALPRAGSARW